MRPFSLFSPFVGALLGACGGNVVVSGEGGGPTTTKTPGEPCAWDGTEAVCPAGTYCLAPECSSGTCEPAGDPSGHERACGCDGLTYYNPSLAGSRSVAVREPGKCNSGQGGKICGGFGGSVCPQGSPCSVEVDDSTWCDGFDLAGPCWVLPDQCDSLPQARSCSSGQCTPLCELLYSGDFWFEDESCPQ